MIKISSQQYAQALFELTDDKEKSEIDSIIAQFIITLRQNGHWRQRNDIMKQFIVKYNEENDIIDANVEVVRTLTTEQVKDIEVFIRQKYKVQEVNVLQKINKKLIGGMIVRVNDEVTDMSISNKISQLKRHLARN